MKKGKYIDFNILLACLSKKPKANNEQYQPGAGEGAGIKTAVVLQVSTASQLVA